MTALGDYVQALAAFMVFSSLVHLITPSGSFKKYIALVLNLMLVMQLLSPLANLLNGTHDFFGQTYLKLQNAMDASTLSADQEFYEREQMAQVLKEYKTSLETKTAALVRANTGATVEAVEVAVNEDYVGGAFGAVEAVHLTLCLPPQKEAGKLRRLALGAAVQEPSAQEVAAATQESIKTCLMDFYNLDKDHIYITVQETEMP